MLKAACPYVSQVVVHGEGRKYATALITLDPEAIEGWRPARARPVTRPPIWLPPARCAR